MLQYIKEALQNIRAKTSDESTFTDPEAIMGAGSPEDNIVEKKLLVEAKYILKNKNLKMPEVQNRIAMLNF